MPSRLTRCLMFIFFITAAVVVLVFFLPAHSAIGETGGPDPVTGETTGDWVIEDGDNIVIGPKTIIVNGNLTIEAGGELHLKGTTLIMNCAEKGQYSITVYGLMELTSGALITPPGPDFPNQTYKFKVIGGTLLITDSTVQYPWGKNENHDAYQEFLMNASLGTEVSINPDLNKLDRWGVFVDHGVVGMLRGTIRNSGSNGLSLNASTASIEASQIEYNKQDGILALNWSKVEIRRTSLSFNKVDGLYMEKGYYNLTGCVLKRNGGGGFVGRECYGSVENVTATNNLVGIVAVGRNQDLAWRGSIEIHNSSIRDNWLYGIYIRFSAANVTNNTVTTLLREGVGHGAGILIASSGITWDYRIPVHIRSNTIIGSETTIPNEVSEVLPFFLAFNALTGNGIAEVDSYLIIENNNFTNNGGSAIYDTPMPWSLEDYYTSGNIKTPGKAILIIRNNTFFANLGDPAPDLVNDWGNGVRIWRGADPFGWGLGGTTNATIINNTFLLNHGSGILSVKGSRYAHVFLWVKNNRFIGNHNGISSTDTNILYVYNNVFSGQASEDIWISDSSSSDHPNKVIIDQNTFTGENRGSAIVVGGDGGNSIKVENSLIQRFSYGIKLENSANINLSNVRFISCDTGIQGTSNHTTRKYLTIEKSTFEGGSVAINLGRYYLDLADSYLWNQTGTPCVFNGEPVDGTTETGTAFTFSDNLYNLTNVEIDSVGAAGIKATNGANVTGSHISITGATTAVDGTNNTVFRLRQCNLGTPEQYFSLKENSTAYLWEFKVPADKNYLDNSSAIYFIWNLDVGVLSPNNKPIKGATVTVRDADGKLVFEGTTGTSGYIKHIECYEAEIKNISGEKPTEHQLTPHNITARKGGAIDYTVVKIDRNTLVILHPNTSPYISQTLPNSVTTEEDTPIYSWVDLHDYFADPEGNNTLSFYATGITKSGFTIDHRGIVNIVPEMDWYGTDVVTIYATDGEFTVYQVVSVEVTPVNDPPRSNYIDNPAYYDRLPDTPGIPEGTTYTYENLDDYLYDPEGDPFNVTLYQQPEHVNVTIDENRVVIIDVPFGWTGSEKITFEATDIYGATSYPYFYVNVVKGNHPPEINESALQNGEMPPYQMNEDEIAENVLDLSDYFYDVDSELQYSYTGGIHLGVIINGSMVSLYPVTNWYGEEIVVFKATDGEYFISLSWNVTVMPVNDPPTLTQPLPDLVMEDGETSQNILDLDSYFYDVDSTIVYTITSEHVVVTLDANNMLTVSAPSGWGGVDYITIKATDGEYTTTATMQVTVNLRTYPPEWGTLPTAITDEDTPLDPWIDLAGYVTDQDTQKEDLMFSVQQQPAHVEMRIDGTLLSLFPQENWYGTDTGVVSVSDGAYVVTATVKIEVKSVNDLPTAALIQPENNSELFSRQSITFTGEGNDIESDVNFYWDFGDGTTAEGEQVSHVYTREGTYTVALMVVDEDGGSAYDYVQITVYNDPPRITDATPAPTSLSIGETWTLSVSVEDRNDKDLSYSWSLDGVLLNMGGTSYIFVATEPGTFHIKVVVSDGMDSDEHNWTIVVEEQTTGGGTGGGTTGGGEETTPPQPYSGKTTQAMETLIFLLLLAVVTAMAAMYLRKRR